MPWNRPGASGAVRGRRHRGAGWGRHRGRGGEPRSRPGPEASGARSRGEGEREVGSRCPVIVAGAQRPASRTAGLTNRPTVPFVSIRRPRDARPKRGRAFLRATGSLPDDGPMLTDPSRVRPFVRSARMRSPLTPFVPAIGPGSTRRAGLLPLQVVQGHTPCSAPVSRSRALRRRRLPPPRLQLSAGGARGRLPEARPVLEVRPPGGSRRDGLTEGRRGPLPR